MFTQEQQLDLTRRLQLMLLEAIMSSNSWERDDVRFQGGTCLSLVYGSSRFSEDLDFVLGTDRGLQRIVAATEARMTDQLRNALPGAQVKFSRRDDDVEAANAKNPRTFMMTVSHADWHRAVKVKVEFWVANPDAVARYEARTATAKMLAQAVDGVPLRMTLAPVVLPAAALEEVLVDKLHALACRDYMKHRDVYDLWWLSEQGLEDWGAALLARYDYHAEMYSESPSLTALGGLLAEKAAEVSSMVGGPTFSNDLKKWLGEKVSIASQGGADLIAANVSERLVRLSATLSLSAPAKHAEPMCASSSSIASPAEPGRQSDNLSPPKLGSESFLQRWTRVINEANPPGEPLVEPGEQREPKRTRKPRI